jgi:hypothetical protein
MDNFIILPKKENTLIIFNKITELINNNFEKLNIIHKKLLIKYLYRVILAVYYYFYDVNFINQLYLNNYQDIFSFLVLLLPYFELNSCKNIKSLDELFINFDSKSKSLSSSYYIDHQEFKSNTDYLEKYFKSNLSCILYTLLDIHNSLMPNWLNIFPHTMKTYKESLVYKNFKYIYMNKQFENQSFFLYDINETNDYLQLNIYDTSSYLKIGYPKLYGVIYNFLYMDIKPIKWIIYDINVDNNKIMPNITYLTEKLELYEIANKPWDKLYLEEKNKKIKLWDDFYKNTINNKISLKGLVLFYLRWEKENENLMELNFPQNCLKIIEINLDKILNDDGMDIDNDEDKIYSNLEKNMENCLEKIYSNIKFERIYNYIYDSVQRFKYTWYGYVCMDNNKNLLKEDDFYSNYFNKYQQINLFDINNGINGKTNDKYNYLTPKNIYNFCKALIHITESNNEYVPISIGPMWNNVSKKNKEIFINRLNGYKNYNWFNISKNIARTYKITNENEINNIQKKMRELLSSTDIFVDIIFETMVYNGIFTYFKYNPDLTDNLKLPDKNKNFSAWKEKILSNIDIIPYAKSYHPFSNTTLETEIYPNTNTIEIMKKSLWYTNFGANWVAQIQLYHHFINNRVLYITGATGAGKSTVAPFLLVYAVKMLNYKNDAKVVCTQPRTQPTKDNSVRIAESIGYPITIKKDSSLDGVNEAYKKTSKDEGVPQNINYIQYKHKKGTLTDDLYHPYLRLYTDGSLYNIINRSYMFKKTIKSYDNSIPEFTSSNLFDVILVDEAHEHNTNMDLILTISKFATYINNQITLGIISATMDDDELIYRKYYEPIDDNWKFPINLELMTNFNKNYIDRRIHLSIPFGGMNFEVKEYPNETMNYPQNLITDFRDMKQINLKVMEILKHILNTTSGKLNSDILIFQPGEGEIRKLLKEINEQTPPNVIAIPFFSKLDTEILEAYVKKIDKPEVRKKIRYPKNKYEISQINDIPQSELLPEGTYTRFVILATNIAEASITIDTFEYVIETGNQKINIYDYDTNQSVLQTIPIAIPNQKQRKGRVGRVKPGEVFYTYDRFGLSEKVGYKLNTENISSFVFDLETETNSQLITANNDPYKTDNFFDDEKLKFLWKQYIILIGNDYNKYFSYYNINTLNKKQDTSKIVYPYEDGKYQLKTLEDDSGKFFIIHPNEDYFNRNPLTLEIIDKNKKPNYFNKVNRVFEYGKLTGMVGSDNLLSPYGKLVNNLADFMEFAETPIDYTKIILDTYSFNLNNDFLVFRDIIMFIVFKSSNLTLKTPNYVVGKSDYLLMMKQIDSSLFKLFDLNDIIEEIRPDMNNYNDVIKDKVNTMLYERNFDSNTNIISSNKNGIKSALISYYQIKIKLDIVLINSKNILKKQFDDIFNTLIEQKKQNKNISDEYLLIINKLMLYYIDSKHFMRKNVILRLRDELENIPKGDSKKLSEQIIRKINKLMSSISIFENENLIKINLDDNKTNSQDITKELNQLSDYDKICFIISKNSTQNILVKVPFTEFYINYFNRDINNIYSLEIILDKYTKTKVPVDVRNYYVFEIGMNDFNELNNILVLSENVILTLDKYFKLQGLNLFKKNTSFDKELGKNIYPNKYDEIMKKIDKIIEYITKS